jgi:membrane fusion protein
MGSPVKPMGLASWLLLSFMVALFAVTTAFLVTARYARKETVPGVVTLAEGTIRVAAQRGGVVSKLLVKEGARVVTGEPLMIISYDPTLERGGGLAEATSANLTKEVEAFEAGVRARQAIRQQEAAALKTQRLGLVADIKRLDQTISLQQVRNDLQRQTVSAAQGLTDRGLMAAITLRQRQDALLSGEQALSQYERDQESARNRLIQIGSSLNQLYAQTAADLADASSNRARYDEKRLLKEADQGGVLTAKRDGIVAALQVREGVPIEPGRTLALILSNDGSDLEAELWAPSRALGFVRPGQSVRIMYDAFPYTTFGVGKGIVKAVAKAPVNPNELPIPLETREALYRVRVKLDANSQTAYQRDWPLSPGMRLTADLILEKRSFWDWLFDPILAAQKRAGA